MITVLIFIVILAVLVLVHELGHFIAARLFGIEVEEFGFGFPPRIFGVKKGGTVWSLNWIPLGGFVRIKGEDKPHSTEPGSFGHKKARVRAAVIVAGVAMNLLLSSVLFSIAFAVGVPQLVEDLPSYAHARDFRVQVTEVLPGLPAEKAGLQEGDIIASIDGHPFTKISDIQAYVGSRDDHPIMIEIRRGQETLDETLTPAVAPDTGKRVMGVALVETAIASYPLHLAIARGFAATAFYVKEIFVTVGQWIGSLIAHQKSSIEFSGPVGIAVLTGRVAKLGFIYLLQFAGLLSVNLAVINILPIPALDGGRLLFIVIERLRGHAVRPKVEAAIHKVAFILLLLLVLFVTIQDVARYKDQILQALKSIFGVA